MITSVAVVLVLVANAHAQNHAAEFQTFWDQFRPAVAQNDNDVVTALGKMTATFKYYNNRDERTTTVGIRQFQVLKAVDYK
jgi:hypothetical protein